MLLTGGNDYELIFFDRERERESERVMNGSNVFIGIVSDSTFFPQPCLKSAVLLSLADLHTLWG